MINWEDVIGQGVDCLDVYSAIGGQWMFVLISSVLMGAALSCMERFLLSTDSI